MRAHRRAMRADSGRRPPEFVLPTILPFVGRHPSDR